MFEMPKIKPCPFCGTDANLAYLEDAIYEFTCYNEHRTTIVAKSRVAAINRWNTRHNEIKGHCKDCKHCDESYDSEKYNPKYVCDEVDMCYYGFMSVFPDTGYCNKFKPKEEK
jgi:hypothetical protein